jgi:hypothetical protein
MDTTLEIPTEPVTTIINPVTNTTTPVANVTTVSTPVKEEIEADVPKEAPKRKGRPVGSKSKEPGKPRVRKAKLVVAPVEEVQQELPRVLPGSLPIPTVAHNDTTAMMLALLQQQAQQRQTHKSDLWRSWFR